MAKAGLAVAAAPKTGSAPVVLLGPKAGSVVGRGTAVAPGAAVDWNAPAVVLPFALAGVSDKVNCEPVADMQLRYFFDPKQLA